MHCVDNFTTTSNLIKSKRNCEVTSYIPYMPQLNSFNFFPNSALLKRDSLHTSFTCFYQCVITTFRITLLLHLWIVAPPWTPQFKCRLCGTTRELDFSGIMAAWMKKIRFVERHLIIFSIATVSCFS